MSAPAEQRIIARPKTTAEILIGLANRTFSPIPKRVMNGSEDTDVLAAAVLSGAPIELEARTVRYTPKSVRSTTPINTV